MFTDTDSNEDTKSTSLLANVTDDSCRLEYTEIVPLTRDTDGPSTTDCDSGDWSAQVKQENLTVVKLEPEDDHVINDSCCTTNNAEHDEDEAVCNTKKEYNVTVSMGSCSNDGSLTAHGTRHDGEELYFCSECGKCFSYRGDLRAHMNIHTDRYKCTECGKCCPNSSKLADHKRTHSGEKPFKCSVCSRDFTQAGHLASHIRIHSGENPYICHVCDKAFSRSGNLNTHMRVHTGDKPYKCFLCDRSFSVSSHLHRHERQVHSNSRPYDCSYCGMPFKTNAHLKRHVRIHTDAKL